MSRAKCNIYDQSSQRIVSEITLENGLQNVMAQILCSEVERGKLSHYLFQDFCIFCIQYLGWL